MGSLGVRPGDSCRCPIEASFKTQKLTASVIFDEPIKKHRFLTGVMDASQLRLALRRNHVKDRCHLIGPDENERNFASAFSLLASPSTSHRWTKPRS